MIFLSTINDLIDELEFSEMSLSNIRNLASLYIVKSQLLGSDKFRSFSNDPTLPSYDDYIDSKRQFQLHEIPAESVAKSFTVLCSEIEEFLQTLYSGTDLPEEREHLKTTLKNIQEKF